MEVVILTKDVGWDHGRKLFSASSRIQTVLDVERALGVDTPFVGEMRRSVVDRSFVDRVGRLVMSCTW